MGATVVPLDGPLDWVDFEIPGGSVPVRLARLRLDRGSRALTALVRFPDGWERRAPGYYEVAEELVVLEGELTVSGVTYRPGDWGYLPAGYQRRGSSVGQAVLALARFSGPPRWVTSEDEAADEPARRDSLGGAEVRCLFEADSHSSWWRDGSSSGHDTELLDLDARVWAWVPAGADVPPLKGPGFCRIFKESS